MLKIRQEQEQALEDAAMVDYQNRMLAHIEKFFPDHYKALEEEKCRTLVDYGIQQAANYNIISERDVCIFIDLMLALGVDFDESSEYPWAEETLTNEAITNPTVRINTVHDQAMQVLKERA